MASTPATWTAYSFEITDYIGVINPKWFGYQRCMQLIMLVLILEEFRRLGLYALRM